MNNRKIDITNLSLSNDIDQILFDLKSNNLLTWISLTLTLIQLEISLKTLRK